MNRRSGSYLRATATGSSAWSTCALAGGCKVVWTTPISSRKRAWKQADDCKSMSLIPDCLSISWLRHLTGLKLAEIHRQNRLTSSPPLRDTRGYQSTLIFGSAHVGGCNMLFCDGRVEVVAYDISPTVHLRAGDRR